MKLNEIKDLSVSEIPKGTTHYRDMYKDPEGRKEYWKKIFTHYNTANQEYRQPMYRWEWYDTGSKKWVPDYPDRFPVKPIEELTGEETLDCPSCEEGNRYKDRRSCTTCQGTGKIRKSEADFLDRLKTVKLYPDS